LISQQDDKWYRAKKTKNQKPKTKNQKPKTKQRPHRVVKPRRHRQHPSIVELRDGAGGMPLNVVARPQLPVVVAPKHIQTPTRRGSAT
jgi:hypothetical protein